MSTLMDTQVADPFLLYRRETNTGEYIYAAGFPSYPANFSRDTIIAGIIAGSSALLASQLEASAAHQGVISDPLTGELPGKIHHEIPGAQLNGRGDGFTTYNACDTTPLFLIGAEGLSHMDDTLFQSFKDRRSEHLLRAADHIVSLVGNTDGLYWDGTDPNSKSYTLRVTYWKDSILPHSDGKEEPSYPVSFAQAHFMAARGLLAASRVLDMPEFGETSDAMYKRGIETFMTPDDFVVYRDSEGELRQPSSDELHALAYIPETYREHLPLEAIQKRAIELATPYGYLCTPATVASHLSDSYHGDKVWVFEQALIHYGSHRFNLNHEAEVAAEISSLIGDGQELFGIQYDEDGNASLIPEGNDQQLWSVAADTYFSGKSQLQLSNWL